MSNVPEVTDLARNFAALVACNLTAETVAEINRRNATPAYACACATHDFMDANALMYGAWCALMFEEPAVDDESIAAVWNAAWDAAKAAQFDLTRI